MADLLDLGATEVRTIFIGGLPVDCTERELRLLFAEGGSCDAVKIQLPPPGADPRTPRGRCTAFVQFPTRERAEQALAFANGLIYDHLDPNSALRVEFAKKDFRRPAVYQALAGALPVAKRPRYQEVARPAHHAETLRARDVATLFIGSLGETVSFGELQEYAASQDGFVKLTLKDEGSPRAVAWAEYASSMHAVAAMEALRGVALPSTGRPPNIEQARTDSAGAGAGRVVLPPTAVAPLGHAAYGNGLNGKGGGGVASSTVFLGGLEEQVDEQEVINVAMSQPGCVNVSCRNIGRPRATAWAQFTSPAEALAACEALRQVIIPSMGRPANVELARSDMRRGA